MNEHSDDHEMEEAREQFEYHRRRHDELGELIIRARKEAAAHHQIMEGLALLHPSLRKDYDDAYIIDRETAPSHRHSDAAEGVSRLMGRRSEGGAGQPEGTLKHPPQGIPALAVVMGDHPGVQYTVQDIFDLLRRRGLAPSHDRVVRNTLNRAVDGGLVQKYTDRTTGTVRYSWRSRVQRVQERELGRHRPAVPEDQTPGGGIPD